MEPPLRPDPSDCCNSGCNPCILDVYEAQLKKYQQFKESNPTNSMKINAISPTIFTYFEIIEMIKLSKDSYIFKFVYDKRNNREPNGVFYTPGQYFMLKTENLTRAYTPIPIESPELGFTVLIKLYDKGEMSKYLKTLKIGDQTLWRGPYGDFQLNYKYKCFFFVAQGTGIAPIYSVIKTLIDDEACESFIKLYYSCRSCDDILLRDHLYGLGSFWNFNYEIFLSSRENFNSRYNEELHDYKLKRDNVIDYLRDNIRGLQAIICGSDKFSSDVRKYCHDSGVKDGDIYIF